MPKNCRRNAAKPRNALGTHSFDQNCWAAGARQLGGGRPAAGRDLSARPRSSSRNSVQNKETLLGTSSF